MPTTTGRRAGTRMSARFAGTCSYCHNAISVGQDIVWSRNAPRGERARHAILRECVDATNAARSAAINGQDQQPVTIRIRRGVDIPPRVERDEDPEVTTSADRLIAEASDIWGPEQVWADGERSYEEAAEWSRRALADRQATEDGTEEFAARERLQEEAAFASDPDFQASAPRDALTGEVIENYAAKVEAEAQRQYPLVNDWDYAYRVARNIVEGRCPDGCCP